MTAAFSFTARMLIRPEPAFRPDDTTRSVVLTLGLSSSPRNPSIGVQA